MQGRVVLEIRETVRTAQGRSSAASDASKGQPFLRPAFIIGIPLLPLEPNTFNSITGILWIIGAHVFMNAGFMARVVSANQIPADQMEAASLDGASGLRKRFAIELPQQLPGILSAGLLVALYSATSYGLVLTLGEGKADTLETCLFYTSPSPRDS